MLTLILALSLGCRTKVEVPLHETGDSGGPGCTPAAEVCDGVDNDCDGLIDDADPDRTGAATWYIDSDADGYGDAGASDFACTQPAGTVVDATDCDDGDATVHPDADEVCDDIDNDCDTLVDGQDDSLIDAPAWYTDADGDGYGGEAVADIACNAPVGRVSDGLDCDDTDSHVHPDAEEVCDDQDNDCDTLVDGQDDDLVDAVVWYGDGDGDGYGDASDSTVACNSPPGTVTDGTDCDDAEPAANPGATEICDDVDNDCDALVDGQDGSVVGAPTWYADADSDGFGDASTGMPACNAPRGTVSDSTDCDDADASVSPAATELCNATDDDCDGLTDGDDPDATCGGGCADVDFSDPVWADCTCATYNSHDYVYCDTAATWADAQATCETVDAHLVVIDDAGEDTWVYDTLLTIHATKWWIGLADLGHTGLFEWVYPQSSGYTNWRRGEPSGGEYCVHHWYEWDPLAWNDEQCTDSKRWICEFEGTSDTADSGDTGALDSGSGDSGGADSGDTADTSAATGCGSSFYCLDLAAQVNRDHTDGPWTDDPSESFDVAPGVQSWVVADGSTVDFVIVDPDTNGGASVALTKGGETWRPSYAFPETFTFDGGGASGGKMYVAGLASGWSDPSLFAGVAATLTITFVDGTSQLVELENGVNLDDWNHTSHSVSDPDAVRVYADTTYGRHVDALSVALASSAEIDTIVWVDDSTVHSGTAEKTSVAIFAITVGP